MRQPRTKKILEKIVDAGSAFPQKPNRRAYITARLALGENVANEEFSFLLDRIYYRHDCTDFDMNVLLRIMYLYGDSPLLGSQVKRTIKEAVLDYDYWIHGNNKNPGKQIFWTENHVMQYFTAEYLAARLYPDELFRMRNQKGRDSAPLIREKIVDWIVTKAKTGFCEWNSNVYADENFHALLNLYDFSKDEEVRLQAKKLLDVMLLELAVNLHHGAYCSSHGRAYDRNVLTLSHDNTSSLTYQLWGIPERFENIEAVSGLALATSSYEVPEEITEIALDKEVIVESRAQQSFNVEDGPSLNHGYETEGDIAFFWQNMAYTHRDILPRMIELEKKYHINVNEWPHREYEYYRACKNEGLSPPLCRCPNYLSRANIYTYKAPEYMMSCAQDFRKGERGFQQHIWQATLGRPTPSLSGTRLEGAILFTTHPGQFSRPSYWAGNDLMPRAVQYKNTLICIHDLAARKPDEERLKRDVSHDGSYYEYSHGFFPKNQFDEVQEVANWVFGRKDDAYGALYSQHPFVWQTDGEYAHRELICHSAANIWICQLGSRREDGSFLEFVNGVLARDPHCDGLQVTVQNKAGEVVAFGWEGALYVDGKEVAIYNYPRLENQFCTSEYMSGVYSLTCNGRERTIDFTV